MTSVKFLNYFKTKATENRSQLSLAGKFKRILGCLFVSSYWADVKLVHWVTGGKRIFLFFILCLFAVVSPERDGILDPIQIYLCFFMFFILGLAISNFIIAKIPPTRRLIDHYLGVQFVSEHGVNMFPRQAAKVGAVVVGAIAIKNGDDLITTRVNTDSLIFQSEALNKVGMTLTPEMAKEILGRPSMSQQCVKTGLEVFKEVAAQPHKGKKT